MEELGNKTIICSVLFLDIVEYSKKSVSGQISLKERFNAFLSTAIRDVPVNDRIILDTGDGAAISFLGDIGDALNAAHSMRSSLLNEGVRMEPPLLVRMGINLGPVRLVKDINGQPNIVGDGINVAQRVMGFANPGQVLVSRSYYDAVSRLSPEYVGMFHYEGSRTDKHVREHELYATGSPNDPVPADKEKPRKHDRAQTTSSAKKLKEYWTGLLQTTGRWERNSIEAFRKASNPQRAAIIAGATVVVVSLIALEVKLAHRHAVPKEPAVSLSEAAAAVPSASSEAASAVLPVAPVSAVASAAVPPKAEEAKAAHKTKKNSRVRTLAETTGGPATLSLMVKPWGEIYLDGRKQGVSPPLMELQIISGRHTLEIRNTTFKSYKQILQVKPGTEVKIQHAFH